MKHFMVQVTMQHLVTGGGPDIDVTLVFETSFRNRKNSIIYLFIYLLTPIQMINS